MRRGRELFFMIAFAILVSAFAALGIFARATYGAQTTADEPQYLLSALSLWEDGNLDISDELADERYRSFHEADLPEQTLAFPDGRRVSPHDPLLPLLLALPMGLGGWIGAKATLAVAGGALAALMVWVGRHRFGVSAATAYVTAGLFALAPPLVIYSTQVYPEVVAALVLLAGFGALIGPFGRRGQITCAVVVIVLPWLAIKYVPLAATLAVAGLIKGTKGARRWLAATFAVAAAAYVAGHMAIYDGLTAYAAGDHFVGGELTVVGSQVDLWGRSTRLIGLLVDRGFGVAAWQPAFFLLPVGAGWALARRREDGLISAISLVITGWLVATFVALTMHGWWFPGRQIVIVLPIAIVLIAAWADEAPNPRLRLLVPLGALGVIASGFLVFEGWQERLTWVVDFGSTHNPFYQAIRGVLPDYMNADALTWALHGLWVVAALLAGWLGRRGASVQAGDTPHRMSTQTPAMKGH